MVLRTMGVFGIAQSIRTTLIQIIGAKHTQDLQEKLNKNPYITSATVFLPYLWQWNLESRCTQIVRVVVMIWAADVLRTYVCLQNIY